VYKESGSVYLGEWSHGIKEGNGKIYFGKTKHTYDGQWKGDRMEGKGVYKWPEGEYKG